MWSGQGKTVRLGGGKPIYPALRSVGLSCALAHPGLQQAWTYGGPLPFADASRTAVQRADREHGWEQPPFFEESNSSHV